MLSEKSSHRSFSRVQLALRQHPPPAVLRGTRFGLLSRQEDIAPFPRDPQRPWKYSFHATLPEHQKGHSVIIFSFLRCPLVFAAMSSRSRSNSLSSRGDCKNSISKREMARPLVSTACTLHGSPTTSLDPRQMCLLHQTVRRFRLKGSPRIQRGASHIKGDNAECRSGSFPEGSFGFRLTGSLCPPLPRLDGHLQLSEVCETRASGHEPVSHRSGRRIFPLPDPGTLSTSHSCSVTECV